MSFDGDLNGDLNGMILHACEFQGPPELTSSTSDPTKTVHRIKHPLVNGDHP
jgi:hypothetical protein